MMISRITIVLFCSVVVVFPFNSLAFSQDGPVKKISGNMPKESSDNLSGISSRKYYRVDNQQLLSSSDVITQSFTMDEIANTYYRKPTIDMVWFVDHPMNGLTPDNSGRSYVKDEIELIIRNLKGVVDLKIALYALLHPRVMFNSQEIGDWNRKLKEANGEGPDSKDRFFQFANFFEPSQLLKNAYLWLTFGIPDRENITFSSEYKGIFNDYLPLYKKFYGDSFSYTNGHAISGTKRDGFFRDPRNVEGVYKKIFVFVTSEDSRRYSARQLKASQKKEMFNDLKNEGSIRVFMKGTYPLKSGSKILFDSDYLQSPSEPNYYRFPSVFSYWSHMALLGGVHKDIAQPSLDDLLKNVDMKDVSAIETTLKSKASERIKKAVQRWTINKYSLHMNNEDFINEIMGKKEAYESNQPVRAMFPARNNAEISEYLYTLNNRNNKKEENNIEKIDVWSFVFDGFSSTPNGKRNELIACTPPPPPQKKKFF
ncbi:MAG: hypothetical protein OXC44_05505, partial [Proteobacteria bacterium]|nr:hypothetical protein [Pseudomonadota bacterium]